MDNNRIVFGRTINLNPNYDAWQHGFGFPSKKHVLIGYLRKGRAPVTKFVPAELSGRV